MIVRKRQRRLTGIDEIVLSLTAKGLTTGEIAAHFDEVYGATVSKDTISTDHRQGHRGDGRVVSRPLDAVYPVIFIDAIDVKVRDGQVANRPIYVAIGVTCDGERDILGMWAGDGGEGAKFWLRGAHRAQEPRRQRRVHRRVRRAQGPTRGDHHRVGPRDHPDVHHALPRHPDYADISGVCAGRAGAGRQNVGIISEGFQERDELVGRPVSAGGGRGRCGPVERLLFEFEIGFEINPCGGDVFVSKPQSDDGGVDAGMEQSHGGGVAKHVRCDVFARQGRARRGGGGAWTATRWARASRLSGPPRLVTNSGLSGPPPVSFVHMRRTPLVPAVNGVMRCFRPLPRQLTWAAAPRWMSLRVNEINSDARRPVWTASQRMAWSRRPVRVARSGASTSAWASMSVR